MPQRRQETAPPWQWALLLPGVANGAWGVLNFFYLPNSPADVGLPPVEESKAGGGKAGGGGASGGGAPAAPVGFVQALRIPNVLGYSIAFGFLKFVNYAMFFWLPFFLALHFDNNTANVISSLYSVGERPLLLRSPPACVGSGDPHLGWSGGGDIGV